MAKGERGTAIGGEDDHTRQEEHRSKSETGIEILLCTAFVHAIRRTLH